MNTDLPALLSAQCGLATLDQLRAAGLPPDVVRRRLSHGWRRALPRVVQAGEGPLDPLQRMIAAALFAGDGAAITSMVAAAWHGVTAASPSSLVHVEVPAARNPRGTGFVAVRRTLRPDERAWPRRGMLIASPARAVASAAADAPLRDQCRALVIEAVQRGICTTAALRHEVEDGPRVGSARVRRALQEAEAGIWSVPEGDLVRAMERSRLFPQVWANPEVLAADGTRLPRPDAWLDDVALAVQVHSRRHHLGYDQWERTVMSDGVFAEYGVALVAVTPAAVSREQDAVLERIRRAYCAAARRPRPDVVATPLLG